MRKYQRSRLGRLGEPSPPRSASRPYLRKQMNPRRTWLWLFLAAALAGLIFFQQRHSRSSRPSLLPLLPNLNPSAVTTVAITVDAPPAGQLQIEAHRTNDGWTLTQPLLYPGHAGRIERLLTKLATTAPGNCLMPGELKDRSKADEQFGFAKPQASLVLEQGTNRMHLLLGNRTAPGDQVFVQVVGTDVVYVVTSALLDAVPRTTNDWRDPTFLSLKGLPFDHVSVTHASKVFELQRDSATHLWRLALPMALRADSAKIDEALETLASAQVAQFISDDPKADLDSLGLHPPQLELAFERGTNSAVVFQFGKTNDTGRLYARRSDRNTVVTIPSEPVAAWRAEANAFRDQHVVNLAEPVEMLEVRGPETFTLRHQTNDDWLVLPGNFVADTNSTKDLLETLQDLKIAEFTQDVVTEPGLTNYGLANPSLKYLLYGKTAATPGSTNHPMAELHFGAIQQNRVFLRRADETSVYAITTNDFQRLPNTPWKLRQRRLWSFSPPDLAALTIRKAGKTCRLVRQDDKWSFAPGSQGILKPLAFDETVRGLAGASAITWVARGQQDCAPFGLTEASLQVTFELKNGDKAIITFGSEAPSSAIYAAASLDGQPWVMEFPWPLFRDVVNYFPVP